MSSSIDERSPGAQGEVSLLRLYLLRAMYALNFALLGSDVWPQLINPTTRLTPVPGVAFSFWAALSVLCALGLRYPLKLIPLLFMQLLYKSIWLVAVAAPLWSAGELSAGGREMVWVFTIGGTMDLLVVPWAYVVANYVRSPGDRWRSGRRSP